MKRKKKEHDLSEESKAEELSENVFEELGFEDSKKNVNLNPNQIKQTITRKQVNRRRGR